MNTEKTNNNVNHKTTSNSTTKQVYKTRVRFTASTIEIPQKEINPKKHKEIKLEFKRVKCDYENIYKCFNANKNIEELTKNKQDLLNKISNDAYYKYYWFFKNRFIGLKRNESTQKVEYAIQVRNLNVYGDICKKKNILKDVSFVIPVEKITCFIGHNGAGKTTTIQSILGLRTIFDGSIFIRNIPARDYFSRNHIGYVPEKTNLDHITALDFLKGVGYMRGLTKQEIIKQTNDFLKHFRVEQKILKISMNNLSAGQNKIICLCQGFFGNPDLIILDEPTDYLDPEARTYFWNYVKIYRKQYPKTTFFIITHNLDEVEKYIDYIVFLHRGQMRLQTSYDHSPGLRNKYHLLCEQWDREDGFVS